MSGGWTVVDSATNKSLPIQGTTNSGAAVPYVTPAPGAQDPVGKFRISAPQALIDTDFEYGTQPTKWESIALQNNRQSMYYIAQQPLTVTSILGDGATATITIAGSLFSMAVGQPIFIQNASLPQINGWWYVTAATASSISAQIATGTTVPASNQYNAALTYLYAGYLYSNCGIPLSSTAAFSSSTATTTVTTTNPHGLQAGSYIYVNGVTSTSANATLGWISGTTMYFNASPAVGASSIRSGYSVTGVGVTGGTTVTATNAATSTAAFITGTVLSVTAGAAQTVGNQLIGGGVTNGTYVSAINSATFVAAISGTALTYASGTIPTIGMVLADSTTPGNLPAGTYIASGTSPNFVLSAAGTAAAADTIVGTSYTVSASQTVTSTTINGYNYTVSASQTVGSQGSPVALTLTSTAVTNAPNGAYIVATVPTANTFTYTTAYNMSGTMSNVANSTTLYARPSGFVEPRSFDGGVAFSAGGAVPGQQLIRQTRRYFRYQSGKGVQFSTGSSLKPALFITSITGSGTTATVTSRYQHNLTVGSKITVAGTDQGVYNGNFTIATVPSTLTFTYTTQIPVGSATTATGQAVRVSPTSWYGSANRVGLFDLQNGMFFEYDGQNLFAVLRNSINQANGTISVTSGSNLVTGTGTQFVTQCIPGAYVVIRGQSYRVVTVASDTSMYVSPEYRGTTIAGALMSLTLEVRIPQSKWQDPCDGTGPSAYNIDLTRMQMWYIDYSWYGAGVVRYGFRATNGQINYVTQIQNNNKQFEAYMRTGNMAAHYESNGISPTTVMTSSLGNTNTTLSAAVALAALSIPLTAVTNYNNTGVVKIDNELIYYSGISGNNLVGCIRGFGGTTAASHISGSTVAISSIDILDCSRFPSAGTVKVQASGQTGTVEYIAFTGNDGSILYGLTRAQTGGQASAQAFTYSATAPISVELSSPDTVPSLSHWGSSVIMDGRFDDDKSLIFNYGMTTAATTSSTAPVVLMAIRIAPSVDNGQVGLLGQKEIINRMQLQLDSLGVVTTGNTYLINLILNGYSTGAFVGTGNNFTSPIQQANGTTSSLAQIAVNTTGAVSVFGGESVAAAFCAAGTVSNLDLSNVRDLGNSILGGGTSNVIPVTQAGFYPDGPDILYVVAQAVSVTGGSILARLSWKEAQA
jgi:hypothetical protein